MYREFGREELVGPLDFKRNFSVDVRPHGPIPSHENTGGDLNLKVTLRNGQLQAVVDGTAS